MPSEIQFIKTIAELISNDKALAAITLLSCLACAALWRVLQKQTTKFQDRLIKQIETQHKMQTLEAHKLQIRELTLAIKSVADAINKVDSN